jgi:hypothetical protein
VLYPVESGGNVVSSFLIHRIGNSWRRFGYANSTVTRLLVNQRQSSLTATATRAAARSSDEYYVLSTPGLGAYFLARGHDENAQLVPVTDSSELQLKSGQTYAARELIPRLINAARRSETSVAAVQ